MQEERRHSPNEQLNMRRRKHDAKFEPTKDEHPDNVTRGVWSPLSFDNAYLELADKFLDDKDTDKAA